MLAILRILFNQKLPGHHSGKLCQPLILFGIGNWVENSQCKWLNTWWLDMNENGTRLSWACHVHESSSIDVAVTKPQEHQQTNAYDHPPSPTRLRIFPFLWIYTIFWFIYRGPVDTWAAFKTPTNRETQCTMCDFLKPLITVDRLRCYNKVVPWFKTKYDTHFQQ